MTDEMENERVEVEFVEKHPPYNIGETANFSAGQARLLVDVRRVARYVKKGSGKSRRKLQDTLDDQTVTK